MTEPEICNQSLAKLGATRISTLDDASQPARFCKLLYAQTRDEVLADHPWNFARKRAALAPAWVGLSGVAVTAATDIAHVVKVTFTAGLTSQTASLTLSGGLADGAAFSASFSYGTPFTKTAAECATDFKDVIDASFSGRLTATRSGAVVTLTYDEAGAVIAPVLVIASNFAATLENVTVGRSIAGQVNVASTAHGLTTGDRITVRDVEGATCANGTWLVTVLDANNLSLDDSSFSGAHTSGTGEWVQVPVFEWAFRHVLPADCLRMHQVDGLSRDTDQSPWEVEGGWLLTDSEEPEVIYISRATDTTKFSPLFAEALAAKLAAKLCVPITGARSQAAELLSEYEGIISGRAKINDSKEARFKRKLPMAGSDLVAARFGR